MVLSDFLSRQNKDNSNPHEIMPIDRYLVQTRSQTQSSRINSQKFMA